MRYIDSKKLHEIRSRHSQPYKGLGKRTRDQLIALVHELKGDVYALLMDREALLAEKVPDEGP